MLMVRLACAAPLSLLASTAVCCFGWLARYSIGIAWQAGLVTVAILAQGTHWAVATSQAFFLFGARSAGRGMRALISPTPKVAWRA